MLFSAPLILGLALGACASRHPGPFSKETKQTRWGSALSNDVVRRSAGSARAPLVKRADTISPKIFILSLFDSEANVWYRNYPTILEQNITLPGASPLFPDAHCIASGEVCQFTLGEGEINAAGSAQALVLSDAFNLTQTYFLIAGIAGVNPHVATTGAVTFSRFAIQFDLQMEFDARQIPSNDSSGYFPQNSDYPDESNGIDYPGSIYGTEVFELNNNLKERFVYLAKQVKLNDSVSAQKYRDKYPYAPANQPPTVVECDTGTSNVYWSGSVLGDAFSNYTSLLTNGSGLYCASQQEDNAILEILLRGELAGRMDFSRVAVMRTASDFDRAPPDEDEVFHLLYASQNGFGISVANIFIAGYEIVQDVLMYWNGTYDRGLLPGNYIGDAFDSLNYFIAPDIGAPEYYTVEQ